jgi:GT2 family glycosyltransferase
MSLIKAVGLFNENYTSWGGEDTEMGYSLAKKGASFYYLYEAVAFHDHEESLEEYKSKLALFAQSGLYELLRNCPEHGSSGYLKLFRSGNILVKVILAILFSSHVQRVTEKIAPLLPARKLAYLMYDHVTYAVIYRNLAKTRNKLIYL